MCRNLIYDRLWAQSFSKKSLLPHSRMPPKKNVTIAMTAADSDAAGDRSETIVEFFEQFELCKAPLHLEEMIYKDSAE